MSIGISVVLPDGVMMVVDSRQKAVPLTESGKPRWEDVPDKLESVTEQIFGIRLGVNDATERAIAQLQKDLSPDLRPKDVADRVQDATKSAWHDFTARFPFGIGAKPWGEIDLVAILLVGGMAQDTPFLAGSFYTSYRYEKGVPRFLVTKTYGHAIFGGNAQASHYDTIENGLEDMPKWEPNIGPVNAAIAHLQELALTTVRQAAESLEETEIGGEVWCGVIRRGFHPHTEILGVIK